jgi:hypothetical protein
MLFALCSMLHVYKLYLFPPNLPIDKKIKTYQDRSRFKNEFFQPGRYNENRNNFFVPDIHLFLRFVAISSNRVTK